MDLKQFENNINKKFKDFEPEVDSLKIWDSIEADLPTKRKSRFAWWIGMLLIPFAAVCFYTLQTDISTDEVSAIEDEPKSEIKAKAIHSEKETKSSNQPISSKAISEKVGKQKLASNNETKQITKVSAEKISPTFAEAKNIKQTKKNTRNTPIVNTEKLANQTQTSNFGESIIVTTNNQSYNLPNEDSAIEKQKALDIQKDVEVEVKEREEISIEEPKEAQNSNIDLVKADDAIEEIEKEIEKEIVEGKIDPKDIELPADFNEDEELNLSKKKLSFSLTAGILASNRVYQAGTTEEEILTIAEKETAEKQLETLQFDAFLKYRLHPRISMGIGLRSWRLSERSNYFSERYYSGTTEVITEIIHHADNTTEQLTTSVPVEYHEIINNTRYQTHTSWSIPIKIYYGLVSKEKFDLEIAAGYEQSINAKHVGYELDANATEYLMTLDPDIRYKKNGGNFLLLDINTNYKLNNSIAFTAGLEGKYGLNGFNTETARFQKKYHFFGLYTGLSYSF